MYIRTMDRGWLKEHAARGPDGHWRCRSTGREVEFHMVMRQLLPKDTKETEGEFEPVAHYFCPACMPGPIFPEDGTPIHENEVEAIPDGEFTCRSVA